jgi:hypothetical protein
MKGRSPCLSDSDAADESLDVRLAARSDPAHCH